MQVWPELQALKGCATYEVDPRYDGTLDVVRRPLPHTAAVYIINPPPQLPTSRSSRVAPRPHLQRHLAARPCYGHASITTL